MKRTRLATADVSELVATYRDAASAHGDATEQADYKAANEMAETVAIVYSQLRRRGRQAQEQLLSLLGDPEPGVRLWAASHALEFAPAEGEAALEQLRAIGKLVGLSAETTLREWREGRLRFP
jgi:hypothetical protein